jgi:hypothetical protein
MAASKDDGSTADSPEDTARAIYNSLGVEDNTEIVLLIGWCTDKQRRLLALFLKLLTCDVIFKNKQWKETSVSYLWKDFIQWNLHWDVCYASKSDSVGLWLCMECHCTLCGRSLSPGA